MYSLNVKTRTVYLQTAVQAFGEVKYALLPAFTCHAARSVCLQLAQYVPKVAIIFLLQLITSPARRDSPLGPAQIFSFLLPSVLKRIRPTNRTKHNLFIYMQMTDN
jgi:hypothetical protein